MQQYDINSIVHLCAVHKIFGMKPSIGIALINHFEGAKNLFSLSETELKSLCRMVPECKRICTRILDDCYADLFISASNDIQFLGYSDPAYPQMLKETKDFPIGLFIQSKEDIGEILKNRSLIGTIGGKDPYSYGIKSCHTIIKSIKESGKHFGVITRACMGIDTLIQELASKSKVPSVSVIPYGFKKEDTPLSNPHSVIITDIPFDEKNSLENILRRDRILAALSRAIILIESKDSYSCENIIENAYSYGKEIWTFPGPINWKGYEYNNRLIRNNIAEIISSENDLIEKFKRI